MSDTLTVILGAGASFDCVQAGITHYEEAYRPPLVGDLFAFRKPFNSILNKYRKAEALSDEIRTKVGAGIGLETILRELSLEDNFTIKKQYWEIPLYLQELLGEVSKRFVRAGATKYDTLVRAIARSPFKEVLFLTVNYDLFLEKALGQFYGVTFGTLDSYLGVGRNWSLIKLHGSVNWGKQLVTAHNPITNSVQLLDSLESEIELDKTIRVLDGYQEASRFAGNTFFYPSLAVPIEGKDEFACPEEHIAKANSFLRSCANILIIGFSALDEHVLNQLSVVQEVRRLKVVDRSTESAVGVIQRIGSRNPMLAYERHSDGLYNDGFSKFVSSGELDRFLRR